MGRKKTSPAKFLSFRIQLKKIGSWLVKRRGQSHIWNVCCLNMSVRWQLVHMSYFGSIAHQHH